MSAVTHDRRPPEPGPSWRIWLTLVRRDFTAVRRSRAVMLPMLLVPFLLMVVLPFFVGLAAASRSAGVERLVADFPAELVDPITSLPTEQQLVVLVNGYLLAPLFLIVPLMVSAVLAADAFAGEKERRTIESLLHLPITDRQLYVGKLATAFIPALAISWIGFAAFAVVSNVAAWPVMHRVFIPNRLWLVMIFWVAPAVAALGLGIMVRVSARSNSTQEANQMGGAVILPLIFIAVGQATGLLLVRLSTALLIGAAVWIIAVWLNVRGASRFTREALA